MSLEEYLRMTKVNRREFADWGKFPYQPLCAWVRGDRLPSLVDALRIQRLTKGMVPVTEWGYAAKQRRVLR